MQSNEVTEKLQTKAVPMESLAEIIALQLQNGGKAKLTVTGVSMRPLFHHRRDSVTLVPANGLQKPGAVILYRRESGQYVLHRIIACEAAAYICCGDNQAERETVLPEQVLAVMDGFTRNGKAYTLDAFGYRVYTAAWVHLFPLRPFYIKIRRRLGNLRSKARKHNKRLGGHKNEQK